MSKGKKLQTEVYFIRVDKGYRFVLLKIDAISIKTFRVDKSILNG